MDLYFLQKICNSPLNLRFFFPFHGRSPLNLRFPFPFHGHSPLNLRFPGLASLAKYPKVYLLMQAWQLYFWIFGSALSVHYTTNQNGMKYFFIFLLLSKALPDSLEQISLSLSVLQAVGTVYHELLSAQLSC